MDNVNERRRILRVAMVAEHSCIRVLKETLMLKQIGYIVDLITQKIPQGRPYYDAVSVYNNERELVAAVSASHADILHVHNEPDWLVPVVENASRGRPIIYDVHDPDHLRGKPTLSSYEIASFTTADACIHISEASKASAIKHYGNYNPHIVIYSYVNRQFTAKDEDIVPDPSFNSVVYEGGVDAITPPKRVGDMDALSVNLRYMPDIVKAFRSQGYAFNLLAASVSPNMLYESIGAYVAKPVIYPVMLYGLRPHGLGFVGAAYKSELMNVAMPNKLFEYISQGVVPVVYNADEAAKFVRKNDCGIALSSLENLRKQLEDAPRMRKNVLKLRKKIVMESQTDKLVNLYLQLLKKKEKKGG